MAKRIKNNGFSLTEVLMAVGILSIGLMLIATMFPAALYMTTIASERTMSAIVADEAFAKIQLYGLQTSPPGIINDYNDIVRITTPIDSNEFSYPSVDPCMPDNRQYYWSALCIKVNSDPCDTQYYVKVFVARKTNPALMYPDPLNFTKSIGTPRPIPIQINSIQNNNRLTFKTPADAKYVNPPTVVLDSATGKLYRIIDRNLVSENQTVTLDRSWENIPVLPNDSIWLIPPPTMGGKNADIEVYQRTIRF